MYYWEWISRDENENLMFSTSIFEQHVGEKGKSSDVLNNEEIWDYINKEKHSLTAAILRQNYNNLGLNDHQLEMAKEVIDQVLGVIASEKINQDILYDVNAEAYLGLLYSDSFFDFDKNTVKDAEKEEFESFVAAWSNIKRNDEIIESIRSRYPLYPSRAEFEKDRKHPGRIRKIYDGCWDYHRIMALGNNLYFFSNINIEKRLKENGLSLKDYSFKNIWEINEKFKDTEMNNKYLFEKTVGFGYVCMIFGFLKDVTELRRLDCFRHLIEKSTKLHAIGIRKRVLQVMLSYICQEEDNIEERSLVVSKVAEVVFVSLEKMFTRVFRLWWSNTYIQYNRLSDEEKNKMLREMSFVTKNMLGENDLSIEQAFLDITMEAGLFDLRLIEDYSQMYNNGNISLECCYICPEDSMNSKLNSYEITPFVYDGSTKECLKIAKPLNEFGRWLSNQTIVSLSRKLGLPQGEALKELYIKTREDEYMKIKKRQDEWWSKKDIKMTKKRLKKEHVFAYIQAVVMCGQLD